MDSPIYTPICHLRQSKNCSKHDALNAPVSYTWNSIYKSEHIYLVWINWFGHQRRVVVTCNAVLVMNKLRARSSRWKWSELTIDICGCKQLAHIPQRDTQSQHNHQIRWQLHVSSNRYGYLNDVLFYTVMIINWSFKDIKNFNEI